MGKLNTLSVKSIKKAGLHADGDGLYLRVQTTSDPNNPIKSWMFRWGAGGKFSMGLGPVRDVSLAQARELAAKQRLLIRQGLDPKTERDRAQAAVTAVEMPANRIMTFEMAAQQYIETQRHGWKNAKHAQQWVNTLATYAHPVIGQLPCSEITTEQILGILKPIWTVKNETATRVRGRIECIMDWATVSGHRSGDNPARWKGKLEHLLPSISKRTRVKHHKAMPYADVPALAQKIAPLPVLSAQALLLCILTATRTRETVEARWSEIDLKQKLWIIPKDRMNRGIEHRVPLSDQALKVLASIQRVRGSPWVFTSKNRKTGQWQAMSNMAMLGYLHRTLKLKDLTVHGFRSSIRDWAGETTDHKREVIEHALAHSLADET